MAPIRRPSEFIGGNCFAVEGVGIVEKAFLVTDTFFDGIQLPGNGESSSPDNM